MGKVKGRRRWLGTEVGACKRPVFCLYEYEYFVLRTCEVPWHPADSKRKEHRADFQGVCGQRDLEDPADPGLGGHDWSGRCLDWLIGRALRPLIGRCVELADPGRLICSFTTQIGVWAGQGRASKRVGKRRGEGGRECTRSSYRTGRVRTYLPTVHHCSAGCSLSRRGRGRLGARWGKRRGNGVRRAPRKKKV